MIQGYRPFKLQLATTQCLGAPYEDIEKRIVLHSISQILSPMDYETSLTDVGFTKPQRIDRAIHMLEGILRGIAIDSLIAPEEVEELKAWCNDNRQFIGSAPFKELIPEIEAALADERIDSEEQADILWLCSNFRAGSIYYDEITADMQRLHGILHGVLADGKLTDSEIRELGFWIDEQDHLKGCYPYDEIESLLLEVLKDGEIDDKERKMLISFFENFFTYSLSKRIQKAANLEIPKIQKLTGICAVCPELTFVERTFCFTGGSARAKRASIAKIIEDLGGNFSKSVTSGIHYLVIGANGNPAWAFACYGRKVEQAVDLRRRGSALILVHEHDFWDAAQDHGVKITTL